MRDKDGFDERQLWLRANVFRHSYIATIVLLLASGLVQVLHGPWASGWHQNALLVWLIIALTSVEMILKQVYIMRTGVLVFIITALSVVVVLMLGIAIPQLMAQGFVQNGMLSEGGGSLLVAILMASIPVAYLIQVGRAGRESATQQED